MHKEELLKWKKHVMDDPGSCNWVQQAAWADNIPQWCVNKSKQITETIIRTPANL